MSERDTRMTHGLIARSEAEEGSKEKKIGLETG